MNPNTNAVAKLANLLQTTEKNAVPRLLGMGFTAVCGRCGGTGSYSYNQTDGDRCFGCAGRGTVPPKLTPAVLDQVEYAVFHGELDAYLAARAAKRALNALVRPLVKEIRATLDPIGAAYDVAYKAMRSSDAKIDPVIYDLQTRANRIFYASNDGRRGGCSVSDIESALLYSKEIVIEFVVVILQERLAQAKALAAELEG